MWKVKDWVTVSSREANLESRTGCCGKAVGVLESVYQNNGPSQLEYLLWTKQGVLRHWASGSVCPCNELCPSISALDDHSRSKQPPRRSEMSESRNGDMTDDDSMGSWLSASPEEGGSTEHKKQKGGMNRRRFVKPKVRERQRGEQQEAKEKRLSVKAQYWNLPSLPGYGQ